jgi:hypothetical protein
VVCGKPEQKVGHLTHACNQVRGQPQAKKLATLSEKQLKAKKNGGVEHLHSKQKVLNSNPSIIKNNNEK